LQQLQEEFSGQGFTILAFPCNQFGRQEPGNSEEILAFATQKYNATFPIFAKIRVNGTDTEPLWKFLKAATKTNFGQSIKWNFTKFLINRQGIPVSRYGTITDPLDMRNDIINLLASNE